MLQDLRKCIVTGNVLRLDGRRPRTNQFENIEWLKQLLLPLVGMHFHAVETVNYGEGHFFDAAKVYRFQDKPMTVSGYLSLMSDTPSEESCDYFHHFVSDALVVGYELPEFITRILQSRHVPYIDLMIGPWRFLPDLTIGIRTNQPQIFARLWDSHLSPETTSLHAAVLRARFAKKGALAIPDNSALIAGQVPRDNSLMMEGGFLGFDDFSAEIRAVSESHARVYFKPHPYCQPADVRAQVRAIRKHGSVRVTTENVYRLMAQPAITSVHAITSSVTQEARFFGAVGHCFSEYPFRFASSPDFDSSCYVATHDSVTDSAQWARWLGKQAPAMPKLPLGSLRSSIGLDWGLSDNGRSKFHAFERLLNSFSSP